MAPWIFQLFSTVKNAISAFYNRPLCVPSSAGFQNQDVFLKEFLCPFYEAF